MVSFPVASRPLADAVWAGLRRRLLPVFCRSCRGPGAACADCSRPVSCRERPASPRWSRTRYAVLLPLHAVEFVGNLVGVARLIRRLDSGLRPRLQQPQQGLVPLGIVAGRHRCLQFPPDSSRQSKINPGCSQACAGFTWARLFRFYSAQPLLSWIRLVREGQAADRGCLSPSRQDGPVSVATPGSETEGVKQRLVRHSALTGRCPLQLRPLRQQGTSEGPLAGPAGRSPMAGGRPVFFRAVRTTPRYPVP